MKNAHKRIGLGAALTLVAGSMLAMVTPMAASAAPPSPNACSQQPRMGHIAGIVRPMGGPCAANAAIKKSDPRQRHSAADLPRRPGDDDAVDQPAGHHADLLGSVRPHNVVCLHVAHHHISQ